MLRTYTKMKYNLIIFLAFLLLKLSMAQESLFYYSSPRNNAKHINPEQVIILKSHFPLDQIMTRNIMLFGTKNGVIPFDLILHEDIVFIKPEIKFEYNETIELWTGERINPLSSMKNWRKIIQFQISNSRIDRSVGYDKFSSEVLLNTNILTTQNNYYGNPQNDNEYPHDYPILLLENYNKPEPGYIFTDLSAGYSDEFNSYMVIMDNYGIPIWFKKGYGADFKVLSDGNIGFFPRGGNIGHQSFLIFDKCFRVVDSIKMGNGYIIDNHDFMLLENGHYLTMAYDPQIIDMSQFVVGGNPEAIVVGLVIQEVDNEQNVYWQWRSWDHLNILDASDVLNFQSNYIDYVHGNAFEFDHNGNLMMSLRNMEEVIKIDYKTGELIWRMGVRAKMNMFTFNDTIGWSWQHDIRQLPNGNITIYDNGNYHLPQPYSQAVEYSIDEDEMTAELVWNYRESPDVYRPSTGSHRRISGGHSLIGWGTGGDLLISEVDESGNKHLDIIGPEYFYNYRAVKENWKHEVFDFNIDTLNFGHYTGEEAVVRSFTIQNNLVSDSIKISSYHHHSDFFSLIQELPLYIPPAQEIVLNASFKPNEIGSYSDIFTFNYDNEDTTERIAQQIIFKGESTLGINTNKINSLIVIPNPTTNYIWLTIPDIGEKNIQLYNHLGIKIRRFISYDTRIEINVSDLLPGIYYGMVHHGNKTRNFRFIKK
jgi:hypothetical protein